MTAHRRTIEYNGIEAERLQSPPAEKDLYRSRPDQQREDLIRELNCRLDGSDILAKPGSSQYIDLQTICSERIIPRGYWTIVARARRPMGFWLWWSNEAGDRSSWSSNHWTLNGRRTACGIVIPEIMNHRTTEGILYLDERIPGSENDCRVCQLASERGYIIGSTKIAREADETGLSEENGAEEGQRTSEDPALISGESGASDDGR